MAIGTRSFSVASNSAARELQEAARWPLRTTHDFELGSMACWVREIAERVYEGAGTPDLDELNKHIRPRKLRRSRVKGRVALSPGALGELKIAC